MGPIIKMRPFYVSTVQNIFKMSMKIGFFVENKIRNKSEYNYFEKRIQQYLGMSTFFYACYYFTMRAFFVEIRNRN